MAENPENMPTSADYAQNSADSAGRAVKQLALLVQRLESRVRALENKQTNRVRRSANPYDASRRRY